MTLFRPRLFLIVAMAFSAVGCDDEPAVMIGSPTSWKILEWAASSSPRPVQTPIIHVDEGDDTSPETLKDQRELLYGRMKAYFAYSDDVMTQVRKIFESSPILGQGNPTGSVHPMTRSECFRIRREANLSHVDNPVCGKRNMVPIVDVHRDESQSNANACIDQYEFPNIPCEYPVVHVSAREAALICAAVGKRLCDAHEWEDACAGVNRDPKDEYAFGRPRRDMKSIHNANREVLWAYGKQKNHALCATGSHKSKDCQGGGFKKCGSNTYPTGAFPKCVSSIGVYDQHGNAAEHMNLPMKLDELASRGNYGETEMKGSWFIFATYEAHEDDCHWRAPDWHGTTVMSPLSHSNYHLGFRCCANVAQNKNPK